MGNRRPRTDDPSKIDRWFARPRRHLSPVQIERRVARLLTVLANGGVAAVLREVATCPELLSALADACRTTGLIPFAQYLDYLAHPHD